MQCTQLQAGRAMVQGVSYVQLAVLPDVHSNVHTGKCVELPLSKVTCKP
jgi:hypothetical protein